MAWEENSRICLHMQLIAILSRIGVTISFYGWRTIRGLRQQRSCSFFVRDKPQGHGGADDATAGTWGLLLMGTQGHNAGCGDENTFYSTLDRIDSGEVPIRVMAEIL